MDLIKEIKYRRFKPEEAILIDILENIEMIEQDIFKNSIFWYKDGTVIFEQNFERNYLFVKYSLWKKLENDFDLKFSEVQKLLHKIVNIHFESHELLPVTINTDSDPIWYRIKKYAKRNTDTN